MEAPISNSNNKNVNSADLNPNDSFVLLNDGMKVEERRHVGRTAVSTKAYSSKDLGVKILREKPALVIQNNYYDYVVNFSCCDKSTQEAILDMYHPPSKDDLARKKQASAERLYQQLQAQKKLLQYSVDFIHKLLAIFACNAHEYTYRENESGNQDDVLDNNKCAALFIWGSKIAHSCHPNLAYTSKTKDGALEYHVIRKIQVGDILSFSYISKNLYKIPTYKRRHFLQRTKAFFCECERCAGPDFCRVVKCPGGCQEQNLLPCIYDQETYQPTWSCLECGSNPKLDTELQSHERRIEEKLTSLNLKMWLAKGQGKPLQCPKELLAIADESSKVLSSTHHITITALEYLATIYSHQARQQQQSAASAVPTRLLAVSTALQAIDASECVAAGCVGCQTNRGDNCNLHDPLYDRASAMSEAALNLFEIPKTQRPEKAVEMVRRYLPILKGYSSPSSSSSPQESVLQAMEREFSLVSSNHTEREPSSPRPSNSSQIASAKPIEENKKSSCCDACGKASTGLNRLLRCSRCQAAWYCDRKCQIAHFRAGHKEQCQRIAKESQK